jgi:hypothetical protein
LITSNKVTDLALKHDSAVTAIVVMTAVVVMTTTVIIATAVVMNATIVIIENAALYIIKKDASL